MTRVIVQATPACKTCKIATENVAVGYAILAHQIVWSCPQCLSEQTASIDDNIINQVCPECSRVERLGYSGHDHDFDRLLGGLL